VASLVEVPDADTRLLATRDARAVAKVAAARAGIDSFRALGGGREAASALPIREGLGNQVIYLWSNSVGQAQLAWF
jgi:hypothetical protein